MFLVSETKKLVYPTIPLCTDKGAICGVMLLRIPTDNSGNNTWLEIAYIIVKDINQSFCDIR